ncbi:MAG: hypothetical protein GY765_14300 [bacterium]|nr:hypothetical protein [bacterium]
MTPWDKPEEYLNEQPDLPDASDLAQPMDDETLVGLVSEELALNAPDGDETTYTSSMKYYFGKPRGDEIAGRSTI